MDDVFDERAARRKAREYARRGLAGDARRIADVIRSDVPAGGTLLEIGGGVGEIQLDLLRDHVARAMNVELATTYETAARELIAERGLADRVERRVADFVT